MPTFKKKILTPGTYRIKGQDHQLTTERFRKWVSNFRKLKKAGYDTPSPFYHDKNAKPVRLGAGKKDVDSYNNGGWWNRLWVAKKDGARWGELDVQDDAKAQKIIKGEIKEVSPAISPTFETSEGDFSDVVTHIAMVTQPVAGRQEPFEALSASHQFFARSLALTSNQANGEPKLDSESEEEDATEGSWSFVMAQEKPASKGAVVMPKKPTPEQDQAMEVPEAATAGVEDALKILNDLGLVLPKDTDEKNFIERLITAACAIRGKGTGQMK
jgi:hypothetical protein